MTFRSLVTRPCLLASIASVPYLVRQMSSEKQADHSGKIGYFSPEMKLHYPHKKGSRYANPWSTWHDHDTWTLMRFFRIALREMTALKVGIPSVHEELEKALPVIRPEFTAKDNTPPKSCLKAWWLGHATVLIQIDGVNVLTDPIFSDRCSPVQWAGAMRYRPVPCTIEDLPEIHAVVISHNHYDHLDLGSVEKLNARFGESLHWFVPEGTRAWMLDRGCMNVHEMMWWDEVKLPGTEVTFAFTPTQHWCKRSVFDYCQELWGSWSIIGPYHRAFFGGDTGYCKGFKEIGNVYGPFDFAAIPIGAYEPRWFMKYSHVEPAESVMIHQDIKAKKSLGIHWGTFVLTTEQFLDPPQRLKTALNEAKIPGEDFFVLNHGGSWEAAE